MDQYYTKYLKYKQKYLYLKKILGGNKFNLISFNILHPFEKVTNISFKNLLVNLEKNEEVRDKYLHITNDNDQKYVSLISDILALSDQKRFDRREAKILKLIDFYIKLGYVICLQEVSDITLDKLNSIYKNRIFFNIENDVLITKTPKGEFNNSRKEYRVTIIPDNYIIDYTNDFLLMNDNEKSQTKKNGVYTRICDVAGNIYHILNIHLHYTYDVPKINSLVPDILALMKPNELDKIIIAGDTNKSLSDLQKFNSDLMITGNSQDESNNTFLKQDTLPISPDHILTNFKGKIDIINDFEDSKIIYDELMMKNILDILLSYKDYLDAKIADRKIPIEESLVNKIYAEFNSTNNYLSDHKLISFNEE
jgi:hypothetical protein